MVTKQQTNKNHWPITETKNNISPIFQIFFSRQTDLSIIVVSIFIKTSVEPSTNFKATSWQDEKNAAIMQNSKKFK